MTKVEWALCLSGIVAAWVLVTIPPISPFLNAFAIACTLIYGIRFGMALQERLTKNDKV